MTVVGLVSTVSKSVTARMWMRTVRGIHLKVDVSLAVLHTSRDRLVKVTRSAAINFICIIEQLKYILMLKQKQKIAVFPVNRTYLNVRFVIFSSKYLNNPRVILQSIYDDTIRPHADWRTF